MLAILSMSHWVLFGINLGLAIVALIALAFILFVVMKQSGNSDGTEAMLGTTKRSEDSETYYGQNASSNKEARLKKWTYICAIILAVCCIAMLVLQAINWN